MTEIGRVICDILLFGCWVYAGFQIEKRREEKWKKKEKGTK